MKTKKVNFIPSILLAQLIATILVIFGHSFPFETDCPSWLIDIRSFIYKFHMPLFVWISGYLLVITNQSSVKFSHFLSKRFRKLLIPYFILSSIALFPKILLSSYTNDQLSFKFEDIWHAFLMPRENIWGHFWFLPMIFILGTIGYGVDYYVKRYESRQYLWGLVFMLFLISFLSFFAFPVSKLFSLNDLISFGWVFTLGAFTASIGFNITKVKSKYKILLLFFLSIFSLFLFYCEVPQFWVPLKDVFIASLMVCFCMGLCDHLSKYFTLNKRTLWTDTFTIFILSWPCQAVSNIIFERILHLPFYIIMISQFIIGLFGPIILIYIFEYLEQRWNFKWISFSLGKL